MALTDADVHHGSLRVASYARYGKLFTGHYDLMTKQLGLLEEDTLSQIIETTVCLLRTSRTQ